MLENLGTSVTVPWIVLALLSMPLILGIYSLIQGKLLAKSQADKLDAIRVEQIQQEKDEKIDWRDAYRAEREARTILAQQNSQMLDNWKTVEKFLTSWPGSA